MGSKLKEVIQELLSEFHRSPLPALLRREIVLPDLPPGIRKAFVFIGMRRVGKTFLLYQDMQDKMEQGLAKEKLLYLNFEDDRLAGFTVDDFQTILDVYYQLYPHLIDAPDLRFYFDEIQNVVGWEKFIRRLLDKEKMAIVVTGSSAKLLSKEIATSLRGRCLEKEVFPLRLAEFLGHQGLDLELPITSKEKAVIQHHCHNYLRRGGFPETLDLTDALHHQTVQSYINSAVFRDVIDRHQLKKPHLVKLFLSHCLQNIAAPLSVTKVYHSFKSRGEELRRGALYEYLDYFKDAYLICPVPIFEFSTRMRQVNPSKIYCVDSGIIHSYSIKPEMEQSACLENAAYIHLRRSHVENIFYYKTESGKEVDFIVQLPNGKIDLYQVSVSLNQEQPRHREIAALVEAAKELEVSDAYIITTDVDEIVELNGITIHILPYWRWALSG